MSPFDALRRYTEALVRQVPGWCERGRASTAFTSRALASGEFRSRRVTARGMEKGEPRVFILEDDPADIDLGRLPAAFDLLSAALGGKLRVVPSMRILESEFIIVIDLSRSMLAGFIDERTEGIDATDAAKLRGLFFVVASYLYLAAGLGFRVRVIYARGERMAREETRGIARRVLLATLARMRTILLRSRRQVEQRSVPEEPFTLKSALRAPLAVPVRSVALIVSDFLDPFAGYRAALANLTARHHVILADVATQLDRHMEPPDLSEAEALRGRLQREGARHLEKDVMPRAFRSDLLAKWNAERVADLNALCALAGRAGAAYEPVGKFVAAPGLAGFARCYQRAFEHLRRLR